MPIISMSSSFNRKKEATRGEKGKKGRGREGGGEKDPRKAPEGGLSAEDCRPSIQAVCVLSLILK